MKICLLGGSLTGRLDEGMRNVTHHYGRELSRRHDVFTLPLQPPGFLRQWRQLVRFQPDVIHYTFGPSILSLFLLRLAGRSTPHAATVVSALHPWFPLRSDMAIPALRPHLVLVQSRTTADLFRRRGCRTEVLYNGVDPDRFKPATEKEKSQCRAEYGLPMGKFILLHVGPVKAGRGVDLVRCLQGGDQQVLIVGSVSTGMDPKVQHSLEASGCLVWRKYLPDIECIYAAADCYIFPTRERLQAIETPLSVLEAMAAGLPVITTRFGALPDIFMEGEGLYYAESRDEFERTIQRIRAGRDSFRTREKVLDFSWGKIAGRLEEIYMDLLAQRQP
jgi:glycosyltransferase involved in cell wall biosynthesis